MTCNLCTIVQEEYRVVALEERVYSIVPYTPLVEGHVMVVPRRHVWQHDLEADELREMNQMIVTLKNKLIVLYPQQHPLIWAASDTQHASIPDHFHYHLVPSAQNLRELISSYFNIPVSREQPPADLERRARLLR